MPPDASSRRLERIRAGDETAFEALFRAHAEGLCRFTQQYVNSPDIAEGLVQEVFLKVWERHRDLSPQGSIKSYLYAAARNQALNHCKHKQVVGRWKEQARHREEKGPRTPEEELQGKQLDQAVWKAIQALPERRRLVFTLSRQHDLTYREIAATLDISVKTVETQMSKALGTLRRRLSTHLTSCILLLLAASLLLL